MKLAIYQRIIHILLFLSFFIFIANPLSGKALKQESSNLSTIWESPDETGNEIFCTNEDLYIVPRYSFGNNDNTSDIGIQSLIETIDNIYIQKDEDDSVLRAGGTEGGGDPTKVPIGASHWVLTVFSFFYIGIKKWKRANKIENNF